MCCKRRFEFLTGKQRWGREDKTNGWTNRNPKRNPVRKLERVNNASCCLFCFYPLPNWLGYKATTSVQKSDFNAVSAVFTRIIQCKMQKLEDAVNETLIIAPPPSDWCHEILFSTDIFFPEQIYWKFTKIPEILSAFLTARKFISFWWGIGWSGVIKSLVIENLTVSKSYSIFGACRWSSKHSIFHFGGAESLADLEISFKPCWF